MKKRYSLIFTITAAAVLVSSIAYASKKKIQVKSEPLKSDTSEVDLAKKLLEANEAQKQKPSKTTYTKSISDEELKNLTVAEVSEM